MKHSPVRTFCNLFLLALALSSQAYDVDSMLNTVQNGKWMKLPTQASSMPPIMTDNNLIMDCDSGRLFMIGNDVDGSLGNTVYMYTLSTLKWRPLYPDDKPATYIQVKSPVFNDAAKFWTVCSTGHPICANISDAAKYIPGKSCFLANVHSDKVAGQPSSWLFNTRTLTWKHLKNGISPNPLGCPMGVSSDGAAAIQLESNGNTWHFDWADSTWKKATVTGTLPTPSKSSLEYDSYLKKFICVGGASYNYHTYDPVSHVWTRLETASPTDLNSCHTGYDTLNHALIAHAQYTSVAGVSATLVHRSTAAKWDTLRYPSDGLGSRPQYEGASFRGEYDLKHNVFFVTNFLTLGINTFRDVWAFRYLGAPAATEQALPASSFSLTASPNPFKQESRCILNLVRSADISLNLYSVDGRLVSTLHQGRLNAGVQTFRLSDNLGSGLYLLKAVIGTETYETRILKLR